MFMVFTTFILDFWSFFFVPEMAQLTVYDTNCIINIGRPAKVKVVRLSLNVTEIIQAAYSSSIPVIPSKGRLTWLSRVCVTTLHAPVDIEAAISHLHNTSVNHLVFPPRFGPSWGPFVPDHQHDQSCSNH